jgi:hypothetical protein
VTATRPTLAGYVAFSGRQVIGVDTNDDCLLETLLETHDPEQFVVRGVTQDVLDAIESGDDCPGVVLTDFGPDGRVYSLR